MARRDASCPLCGAKMQARQVLDACEELVDAGAGVLGCHCPYCQGYFEVRPAADQVEIGYLQSGRFASVVTLPAAGLRVLQDTGSGLLRLRLDGSDWKFAP